MSNLFFEIIRVAIGNQDCLSRLPSNKEWITLYHIAQKQSLIGVCFAALQRLGADAEEGFSRIGMSEMLYLTWMGLAAKIQQKNEIVNHQCTKLQATLTADGIRSCILKGQAVASQYGKLALLRQSGDIDVLVDCDRKSAVDYVHKNGIKIGRWDYKHLDIEVFQDTEVEMHYRPGVSLNLWRNRRLQKFWKEYADEFYANTMQLDGDTIISPSSRMHTFYIMHHTFRHLISGGIGMRQMMDLYFAILNRNPKDDEWLKEQVASFGMKSFAEAATWIMGNVFGLGMIGVPWIPDEREGRFVLNEIMIGGNFGKKDERYNKAGSHLGILGNIIHRDMHLAHHYGSEAMMAPLFYMWHFCWKRMNK